MGAKSCSPLSASDWFDTSIGDIFITIETGCLYLPKKNDRNPTNILTFIVECQANSAWIMEARADV